jgi:hypothetical protein
MKIFIQNAVVVTLLVAIVATVAAVIYFSVSNF